MRYQNYYPRYVTVAEKKAKARAALKYLKKKRPDIRPVTIQGRTIARSWWGKAWNDNLEGYADYSNRIGRGRSYVRHGAVLDLGIEKGKISALVQGTDYDPYRITITIDPLSRAARQEMMERCRGQLDSMEDLLSGKLPHGMKKILTDRLGGIFPEPDEIRFKCSCPDWASMCKHVAAALYGTGARLDQDPSLFFKLRGMEMSDLVTQVVQDEADHLLKKARSRRSSRIIADADLSEAFGIDMDDGLEAVKSDTTGKARQGRAGLPASPAPRKKRSVSSRKKTTGRKRRSVKTAVSASPPDPAAGGAGKASSRKPTSAKTPYDIVVGIVRRRKVNPIDFKALKERTGLDDTLLRNCIQRGRQKKVIQSKSRGQYICGPAG